MSNIGNSISFLQIETSWRGETEGLLVLGDPSSKSLHSTPGIPVYNAQAWASISKCKVCYSPKASVPT